MRNRLSMHTAQDDCVLSTMRFVSKSEDCQVYGALLPEVTTNQKIQNFSAYKTYLAYATGAATPKKARKFKKPTTPSKKRTLFTVEEEEPEPTKKVVPPTKPSRKQSTRVQIQDTPSVSVSKNKTPAKAKRSKGIDFEGSDFESEVPDEPKGKSIDTSKGTSLKPGVPDVSKADSSESEYESWRDSGDEANVKGDDEDVQDSDDEPQQADDERSDYENQETNDDEEESDDEFVHTPPNYVPTDDETNDESNVVDEEEYDRIDKELYRDVNVRLTDAEQDDEDEEDADMTNVAHVQVEQTQEQTMGVQEESGPEMASVQGQFMSTETEVVSMLDINVQHEVPRTSPLLTIPISVIPEHTVFNPSDTKEVKELKNVDHSLTLLSKIKSEVPNAVKEYLGTSLDDAIYKVLKKHDDDNIKEFSVPAEIVERLTQQYLPQSSTKKSTEDIQKIKMEHASKQQVPKFSITSSDSAALEEFDQKTTLFNTMTKPKSFNKSPKHRALYHALMESVLEDEDAMDKGVANKLKKRKPNNADQDEGPTAGSD
ncbi:hypothetical protein Tco_0702676 [Tanacetum coccineum]|uniref:Uncharacterized protein n=1 Tax=Tanacetum coccineum TaxID=301880 RepID=A0ABQ4XYG3_9ASTR